MGILISISTATRPILLHPLRDLLAFFGIHRLAAPLRLGVRHRAAIVAVGALQLFQLRYRRFDSFNLHLPIATKFIVYVSTNEGTGCPIEGCDFFIGLEKFQESCNHLLQKHGLKCLHVGQETSHDNEGKPWHSTVAVFGK